MGSKDQVEAFAWETNNRNSVQRREGGERALGQTNSGRISCPCLRCIWEGGGRCQGFLLNSSHLFLEEVQEPEAEVRCTRKLGYIKRAKEPVNGGE